MKNIILLCIIFTFANASPTIQQKTQANCRKLLTDSGASDFFGAMVAHGIHAMTLDDLKIFDPLATENNFVPTVARDLHAEIAVLPYTPDWKSKDSHMFLTDGMKVLDSVLSHMNDKSWDNAGFSPLERVEHAFHMRETWARIKIEYDQIGKTNQAPDADVCACAMDIENNGVMQVLQGSAMALRDPEHRVKYGKSTLIWINMASKAYMQNGKRMQDQQM